MKRRFFFSAATLAGLLLTGCLAPPPPRATNAELRSLLLENQKQRDAVRAAAPTEVKPVEPPIQPVQEAIPVKPEAQPAAALIAPAANQETLLVGAVPTGDLTQVGDTQYIQNGTTVMRQEDGVTTFTQSVNPGQLPQFVQNPQGQEVGPLRISQEKRLLQRTPETPARDPGLSEMPTQPDIAPSPATDLKTRTNVQGLQPGFSDLPARPEIAPSPVRKK